MDKFINALQNFEINEIVPTLDRIINHLEKGYITQEDKFFIDYCLPLIECSNKRIKLILKGK